jgi:integrase/recombinase XerD
MLSRRGEQAGIQNVHPHRFRRSFADSWLAAGGSTDDLMHITGWKTYDMVREYTEGKRTARQDRGIDRIHAGPTQRVENRQARAEVHEYVSAVR